MKTIIKLSLLLLVTTVFGSCYDDFTKDYPTSSVCFAIQKPLRTVVADRDMQIFVGVSIGGKREVDMNDWAKFEIKPELLVGTNFTLLPPTHYLLTSPDTFKVRKSNLPVADVGITFTPAFYDDPLAMTNYYALPLSITEHSLDLITPDKGTSIVVFKYISTFHGTYYVRGKVEELDALGSVVATTNYYNGDISQNITRPLVTLSRYSLRRDGLANLTATAVNRVGLTFQMPGNSSGEHNVLVGNADGATATAITEGSGTYYANEVKPRLDLKYKYVASGKTYSVEESLYLRRDPVDDLRVETW